jgi:hypothetical protein
LSLLCLVFCDSVAAVKPSTITRFYGLSVCFAFGAGWFLKTVSIPDSASDLSSPTVAARRAGPAMPTKPAGPPGFSHQNWLDAVSPDLAAVRTAAQPGVVNQVLIDKLEAILSLGDPSIRNPQWQTVLTAMRAVDAVAIKELFRAKAREGRHFESEFEAFCHRWGQLDGAVAAPVIVSEYAGKESVVSKVMQGWGSRDTRAALAWVDQQQGISKGISLGAIVEGLGHRSPSDAEALILANPGNPDLQRFQGRVAAMKVAQEGLAGALPWFDQIASSGSPDKYKQSNLETLLKIINQGSDSHQSIALARRYADRAWLPASAGEEIGLAYLGQDPPAVLNQIGEMPSIEAQKTATRIILNQWGPEAASEWLAENPQHPVFDTGALVLVESLAKTDPEAAAAWASQIKDGRMKSFADTIINVETILQQQQSPSK